MKISNLQGKSGCIGPSQLSVCSISFISQFNLLFTKTSVPKFIQGYNGKPALVTKSGTFTRHENYIEFSINVNMWAFLAKKGLWTLEPTFPDFIFNVGFTIEARKDEEMPGEFVGMHSSICFCSYPVEYDLIPNDVTHAFEP